MTTMAEQVESEQSEHDAEREAEDAEHDGDDETENKNEEAEAEEAEAEPEALATIGPDEIRKAERAIDAERKKLAGILGDAYVAHDCPLCSALGFLPELPPEGTTLLVSEGEAGIEFLAMPPQAQPEYVDAKDKGPCDWCNAEGLVRTGSRNPNAAVMPCSKCSGNGWVMIVVNEPAPALPPPPPPVAPNGAPMYVAPIGPDAWGRPEGHTHWGVPPANIQG